jgi:hypothetical protein
VQAADSALAQSVAFRLLQLHTAQHPPLKVTLLMVGENEAGAQCKSHWLACRVQAEVYNSIYTSMGTMDFSGLRLAPDVHQTHLTAASPLCRRPEPDLPAAAASSALTCAAASSACLSNSLAERLMKVGHLRYWIFVDPRELTDTARDPHAVCFGVP